MVGYTNSYWAGSGDDRKSTSEYVFHWGSRGISWAAKKQSIASLLTQEYVAAIEATCQAVWMRRMLKYLCHQQEGTTTIYYNNNFAITLSKNSIFYKRSKHIDTKYHFIRKLINNGEIVLQHCRS